jgi:chromosome segregation ATPase
MSQDSRESVHLEIPIEVKEAIKMEDETMWKTVTDAVRVYLAVDTDSLAALQRQADRLENDITDIETRIQSLDEDRKRLVDKKERVQSQIDDIKECRRSYEEILDAVIDNLADDRSLGLGSQTAELEAAAEIRNDGIATDESIEQVCCDVRSRVNERDVDLDPQQLHRDFLASSDTPDANLRSPGLRSLGGANNGSK